MRLGLRRSKSPTFIQMRIGFKGELGMSCSENSPAPCGISRLEGHCWLVHVPERR